MKEQYEKLVYIVNNIVDEKEFEYTFEKDFFDFLMNNSAPIAFYLAAKDRASNNYYSLTLKPFKEKCDTYFKEVGKLFNKYDKTKSFAMVKGFILSWIIYNNIYARNFGDIDIVTTEKNICNLCLFIEKIGYNNVFFRDNNFNYLNKIEKNKLKLYHYGYDFENVFLNETNYRKSKYSNEYSIEIKTCDYVFEGGIDSKKTEKFLKHTTTYNINGKNIISFNIDYTLCLLISNTYRDMNTNNGQQIDFKINDLIDVLFFLKKYNYNINKVENLLIPLNMMHEFYVVIKYINEIFKCDFIKYYIELNHIEDKVNDAKYYTYFGLELLECFWNKEKRINIMERQLKERIIKKLSNHKMNHDCYKINTTKVFQKLSENEISINLYLKNNNLLIELNEVKNLFYNMNYYICIRILDINKRSNKSGYNVIINFYNDTFKIENDSLNAKINDNGKGVLLELPYNENIIKNKKVCFCVFGSLQRPYSWLNIFAWMKRKGDPVYHILKEEKSD